MKSESRGPRIGFTHGRGWVVFIITGVYMCAATLTVRSPNMLT